MADERLRLKALSAEDLAVISAMVQDAVLKVADMGYDARRHCFALVMNRFRWEKLAPRGAAGAADAGGELERVRTGLHFEGVLAARCRGVPREDGEAVLELLAISWEPAEDGVGGRIRLEFAGGASVQLDAECLEAYLCDLTAPWPARRMPVHEIE